MALIPTNLEAWCNHSQPLDIAFQNDDDNEDYVGRGSVDALFRLRMKLRESDPHGEALIYNEPLLEEEESKEEDDHDSCDADVKDKDEIRL